MNFIDITTKNGCSSARFIPALGGMACSIQLADGSGQKRELLYLPEDWQQQHKICGGWPVCFPICGRLTDQGQSQYLHNGQRYAMGIHGFAHQQAWQVIEQGQDTLTLQLTDTAATRKVYPFAFCITLKYVLEAGRLICHQRYQNLGSEPMPYYAGFHPYFWIEDPSQKNAIQIEMSADHRVCYNEDLTDIIGQAEALSFPAALTDPLVNESLHQVVPGAPVRLHFPDGFTVSMHCEGENRGLYRYIQLYHIPNKPFFCIEPWMASPNSLNHADRAPILKPGEIHAVALILQGE